MPRAAQIVRRVELGAGRSCVAARASAPQHAEDLARHLLPQYGALPVEHFGIVMLDTKHRVLRVQDRRHRLARHNRRPPREVFPRGGVRVGGRHRAVSQSSSGDPTPSRTISCSPRDGARRRVMGSMSSII
jgi:DNA repair protein RadC